MNTEDLSLHEGLLVHRIFFFSSFSFLNGARPEHFQNGAQKTKSPNRQSVVTRVLVQINPMVQKSGDYNITFDHQYLNRLSGAYTGIITNILL